jgi:hypothetical protein
MRWVKVTRMLKENWPLAPVKYAYSTMKIIVIAACARGSQSMALRAGLGLQASPGIEPGPAWQGGGVSWPKANST